MSESNTPRQENEAEPERPETLDDEVVLDVALDTADGAMARQSSRLPAKADRSRTPPVVRSSGRS
ncbi:hypothetical protein AHiyo8_18190 [Arthrobacter sp. Hiyo8]|nr:hypothetical protein AHiyo8_18190 [Arthrobacter sp. Hiyo8]